METDLVAQSMGWGTALQLGATPGLGRDPQGGQGRKGEWIHRGPAQVGISGARRRMMLWGPRALSGVTVCCTRTLSCRTRGSCFQSKYELVRIAGQVFLSAQDREPGCHQGGPVESRNVLEGVEGQRKCRP